MFQHIFRSAFNQ